MYRTVGIDLAAQPERTALCVIDWPAGAGANLVRLARGLDDEQLLDAMAGAGAVGIDAPFGWPRAYTGALAEYFATGAWPLEPVGADPAWHLELRFRTTDRAVRQLIWETRGVKLSPLSVSSDRIVLCGWRAAGLLHHHTARTGTPFDRSGQRSALFEVYPAAALASWGLPFKGYKSVSGAAAKKTAATATRRDILHAIEAKTGAWLALDRFLGWRTALIETDDALDAFLWRADRQGRRPGRHRQAGPRPGTRRRRRRLDPRSGPPVTGAAPRLTAASATRASSAAAALIRRAARPPEQALRAGCLIR